MLIKANGTEKWVESKSDFVRDVIKFYRMKDIATAIAELSLDTGYDEEFLSDCVTELVNDGESYEEAFKHVKQVAEEYDY